MAILRRDAPLTVQTEGPSFGKSTIIDQAAVHQICDDLVDPDLSFLLVGLVQPGRTCDPAHQDRFQMFGGGRVAVDIIEGSLTQPFLGGRFGFASFFVGCLLGHGPTPCLTNSARLMSRRRRDE